MPEAEVILWSKRKGKQMSGYKFRRQVSVGPFVIDFYCPSQKVAIEIDGESHFVGGAPREDAERQRWIEQFGVRFIRFTNDEIRGNLDGVLMSIEQTLAE
ncbi:MAG: endonuclease domain-containing protein [Ignavibacteriales bacterium]|nr:endonuclease domain-containing protein [Ignavibacteriales bacterium]